MSKPLPSHRDGEPKIETLRSAYIDSRDQEQQPEKQDLARRVVEKYIFDFQSVLLDSGTSARYIANEMFRTRRFLSVLTNNMTAYEGYRKTPGMGGNELILTGGRYFHNYDALLGTATENSIGLFFPNVTIIGV